MSDLMKVTLLQPSKIHGITRAIGWEGEVEADIFAQLTEAGAISAEPGEEPVLIERGIDPRDELITQLQDKMAGLRFELDVAQASAALSTKLVDERDQALAKVTELEARLAEVDRVRSEALDRIAELEGRSATPAPKKTKAAASS